MLAFAIFAVTFVVVLLAAVIYLYPGSRKATTIPGMDPSDPVDGNFADISKAGSLYEFLMDLHDEYGDIASFWMGSQFTVSIASPKLFAEQCRVFDRPPQLFELFSPLITGESIQFANGVDGRSRRNLYDRCYSHDAISNCFQTFQQTVDELVMKLSTVTNEDHIPLRQYMFALAIKSISRVSFGDYFKDDKKILDLGRNYDICWAEMEKRLTDSNIDAQSSRQKRFDKANKELREIIGDVLKIARQSKRSDDERLLVDMILESGASDERMFADTVTYMVAAFHTTGLLMTWCFYFLATHKDIQDKALEEIQTVLEDEPVTPESIKYLKYLRQVIDETLRCSTLAPWVARYQDMEIELGGHIIPKSTPIIQALGVVMNDSNIWPDPNVFDPDRFTEENKKSRPPFSFEPFGFAGKRKCPGHRLACTEAIVWLVTLLRKFEFRLVEGQVIKPVFGLVTNPCDEIWITVQPRK